MHYFNNSRYKLFCAAFITVLLLMDLGQFFLVGTMIVPLLFCLYCTLLCRPVHSMMLISLALLQCLEFFCFYNFFSLAFVYLIPTTILALFFKKYLYPSRAHILVLATSGALIQIYAIEGSFLGHWQPSCYTIMRIGAILLITMCFSLTINIWGMQDNRA